MEALSQVKVLVTGAEGFIGSSLVRALRRKEGISTATVGSGDSREALASKIEYADVVYHLAGANRPKDPKEFQEVNADLTQFICQCLEKSNTRKRVVYSSSVQAELENDYGRSKRAAEEHLLQLKSNSLIQPVIYRLPNVFGKGSKPHYNSAIATFCSQIAKGEPIQVSDPSRQMQLVYIDDVVSEFLRHLGEVEDAAIYWEVHPIHRCTLQSLVDRIYEIANIRESLCIPDLKDPLNKALYTTYQWFVDPTKWASDAVMRHDARGWLFELTKSSTFGQVFVSKTLPGITRGNHYHETKLEKFCLIQGRESFEFGWLDRKRSLSIQ